VYRTCFDLGGSTDSLVPVGAIDLGVDWAVVVSQGVYPVIGLGQSEGGGGPGLGLPPHQRLQLPELVPEVWVGGRDGLRDAGVEVGHPRLGGRAQVSVALESADIVAPEPGLLSERDVAGVQVQRHGGDRE